MSDGHRIALAAAAVGSTTREAITRMYGRNKGFLGATSTSARLEERPLLSETEARLMDPDEVIILASPQHPITASRIQYYDDPFFKEMLARQEGKPFPYSPSVQGVGPWGSDGGDQVGAGEQARPAGRGPVRDRSQRHDARAMSVMALEAGRGQPEPETLKREAAVPKEWEAALDRQEDFIKELLSG